MPFLQRLRRFTHPGVVLALASAGMFGLTPIFGKLAIRAGIDPLLVVAVRTLAAFILLLISLLLFRRQYLYIFPLGLVGCLLAGGLNGLGSLFFYAALGRLDAGLGQMLYALYPLFVALLLYLDGQSQSRLTLLSLLLIVPAILLLTSSQSQSVDWTGVIMMLVASFLYAIHIPINQRVLYEAPAQTVTLYTLLAMTVVVIPGFLLFGKGLQPLPTGAGFPLLGLTLVTFFSRLLLFAGVKSIGGMRTSVLGLAELLVTIALATLWLGESLTSSQWLGALILVTALILAGRRPGEIGVRKARGWLAWISSTPQSQEHSHSPGE
jgi:drug/metabolite transporter (DMT)-like permease